MQTVIAFTGLMGSGKNTLATALLAKDPSFKEIAFADPIKTQVSKLFNLNTVEQYEQFKQDQIGLTTGRLLVREIGMLMRSYNENQFVAYVERNIKRDWNTNWLITDLRFQNEFDFLTRLRNEKNFQVIIVKLDRELSKNLPSQYLNHESEAGFEDQDVDLVIRNLTIDASIEAVQHFIKNKAKDLKVCL